MPSQGKKRVWSPDGEELGAPLPAVSSASVSTQVPQQQQQRPETNSEPIASGSGLQGPVEPIPSTSARDPNSLRFHTQEFYELFMMAANHWDMKDASNMKILIDAYNNNVPIRCSKSYASLDTSSTSSSDSIDLVPSTSGHPETSAAITLTKFTQMSEYEDTSSTDSNEYVKVGEPTKLIEPIEPIPSTSGHFKTPAAITSATQTSESGDTSSTDSNDYIVVVEPIEPIPSTSGLSRPRTSEADTSTDINEMSEFMAARCLDSFRRKESSDESTSSEEASQPRFILPKRRPRKR